MKEKSCFAGRKSSVIMRITDNLMFTGIIAKIFSLSLIFSTLNIATPPGTAAAAAQEPGQADSAGSV